MSPRKKSLADMANAVTDEHGRVRHAPKTEAEWRAIQDDIEPPEMWVGEDGAGAEDADKPTLTINQLVAMNVQRVRKARGWSQEELGEALTRLTNRKWSPASVSAAESSWRGGRVRRFDANELVAFSLIFKLPVSHFLLPPTDDDLANSDFVVDTLDEIGLPIVTKEQLLRAIWDVDLPAEFLERLKAELRSVGHQWSEDRHTVALQVDDEMLPRLIRALQNVAGLDFLEDRPEMPQ